MEHLTCKGLVIRETDFGDTDRYISVLTEEGRRIEVLCKGVRRRGGRMMNAVRLFCYSELTLYQGRRGKYTLQGADLIASFWGVTGSMETYALCCYLAELVGQMTDTEEDSPAAARLFLYALHALADQGRDRLAVKAAFARFFGLLSLPGALGAAGHILFAQGRRLPLRRLRRTPGRTGLCTSLAGNRLGGPAYPDTGDPARIRLCPDRAGPRAALRGLRSLRPLPRRARI